MATLTIFANFFINDEERLQRVKDSFLSFKDIGAEKWVINVRGKYKTDVQEFLKNHLGDTLVSYTLDSKKGWFFDTKQMLGDINTDYVLVWLEDHINMTDVANYKNILEEMKVTGSEYMTYSWWFSGRPLEMYKKIKKMESNNIFSFILDEKSNKEVVGENSVFIISLLSILSTPLFKKIIQKGPPILRGYPKITPLDFEKGPGDLEWLPIHYAIPKYELFASIDDGGDGYSLQGRGLYPKRVLRDTVLINTIPYWKLLFRSKIKKYIPSFLYKKLIQIIIFYNRFSNYINLLRKGL